MKLPTAALRAASFCVDATLDVDATLREFDGAAPADDMRPSTVDRARYVADGAVDVWT
ncbi:hypothetical protein [Cognatilysobacter terrigena]|uniref:hypothetical protein n=1 Tax=Cognatilysobacter terrigena TaxID=2488749 RepID=UPI0014150B5E|nr:hypothetical protein [Lysobacter terrigena]